MKQANKELLRRRANEAIYDMYHNATLPWDFMTPPDDLGLSDQYCNDWITDTAQYEIEYIGSGGAYGPNYRATLMATCGGFPGMWKEHIAELMAEHEETRLADIAEQCRAMEESRPDMYGSLV